MTRKSPDSEEETTLANSGTGSISIFATRTEYNERNGNSEGNRRK